MPTNRFQSEQQRSNWQAPNMVDVKNVMQCDQCGTKTSRHFYIGNTYHFSLCSKCRVGNGHDHEINITYMKKALSHFQRLWRAVLNKECIKLTKEQNIPKLYTKDDFFRSVPRYENYFSLSHIKNEIASLWKEKIDPLCYGGDNPLLAKYNPISTFIKCVDYVLTRKTLKSKFVDTWVRNRNKRWDEDRAWIYYNSFYEDFDFSTYSGKTLFGKKCDCYMTSMTSFQKLQALFRGYIVRKRVTDKRRLHSAVEIQAAWRKKSAMLLLKKHKQCAVKIQALCRGYYVRRPFGIYRSWALWNAWGAHNQSVPQQLETTVHNMVRHGAVQKKRKKAHPTPCRKKKKTHNKKKTLNDFWV